MDRARFSIIAHGHLPYWNPVGERDLLDLISRTELTPESRVLDIGCGRALLLTQILDHVPCSCLGIDIIESVLDEALPSTARFLESGNLELRCEGFQPDRFADASFDLTICIGSTHAVGDFQSALETLAGLTKPGGHVLAGEGYWLKTPPPAYLDFLDMKEEEHTSHSGNLRTGTDLGLRLVASVETSLEDWDRYEETYAKNVRDFARQHPEDADVEAMLARIEPWNRAYRTWGRGTLGFGLYLFRKPEYRR